MILTVVQVDSVQQEKIKNRKLEIKNFGEALLPNILKCVADPEFAICYLQFAIV